MVNPIKSIVIVGGGSAGWMSASYLQKVLSNFEHNVEITVIEPTDIPVIGVGEATIPTIKNFFSLLDIPEVELLIKSDASLKTAIKFNYWNDKNDNGFYHPFDNPSFSDGITIAEHWLALKQNNKLSDPAFAIDTGIVSKLCEDNLVFKSTSETKYNASTPYAYHLDAIKMSVHLKKLSLERGVKLIKDKCTNVNIDVNGNISSIDTEFNGKVSADFFIDCTGFQQLLIGKALGDTYTGYDELLCNRALTAATKLKNNEGIRCYTTATALSSGWAWEIDLPTRTGNGYVYSSKFQTEESAKQELAKHLNKEVNELTFKVMQFNPGRRDNFWKNNCLSIGLSAGFIEPLESTGLQLIEVGLRMFFDHFPNSLSDSDIVREQYNLLMREQYDEAKDFVHLHYLLSKRNDTDFWRKASDKNKMSSTLEQRLKLWQQKLPSQTDFRKYAIFTSINYIYILAGMNYLNISKDNKLNFIPEDRSIAILQKMKDFQKNSKPQAIKHPDFIERIRAPFGL